MGFMSARREKYVAQDAHALKAAAEERRRAAEAEAERKRVLGEAVQRAVIARAEREASGEAPLLSVEAARAVAAEAIAKTHRERAEEKAAAQASMGSPARTNTPEPQKKKNEANETGMTAMAYTERYLRPQLDAAASAQSIHGEPPA